jgi:hypothetical protein
VCERRCDARDEIEDREPDPAETVLNVVPEDPQEQHVETEVEDVPVHEHRREHGHQRRPAREGRLQHLRELRTAPDDVAGHGSVPEGGLFANAEQ